MADSNRIQGSVVIGQQTELTLHAVRGTESLSRPFRYEVDFTADTLEIQRLRGAPVQVHLTHPDAGERYLSGVVLSLAMVVSREASPRYRAEVVPFPSLLRHRQGFRIFQEKSAPDIVKAVLQDAGIPGAAVKDERQGSCEERAFCVQYQESEWDFISRLMEDEGIHYAFVHSQDGHVLSLRDTSAASPKAEPSALPYHGDRDAGDALPRLWGWRKEERATVTQVALNDYDGLRPSSPMLSQAQVQDAASGARELYEYPAGFGAAAKGSLLAQHRLDAERVARTRFHASTNALSIQVGTVLELQEHPTDDGEYLVVAAELDVRVDEEPRKGPLVNPGSAGFEVRLMLIPKAAPFRPARVTPRPLIAGVQTAIVVGPAGEEIHCDAHGRVKLQFHWDPDGKLDDHSSCWIRVGQAHTTGSVMIPRVGWEVLVEFLGGDPDRPLAQGRLYNPLFPPPAKLPDQRTLSGHQSHSSPGGGGENTLRFDDAAGSESLHLSGHRDVALKVANNQTRKTTQHEKVSIGKNHQRKVGADEKVSVAQDASLKVGASHKLSVGTNRVVKVDGMIAENMKGAVKVSIAGAHMLQVGNPASAVLSVIESSAIAAAQGAAASAVSRAQGALLAPLAPALAAARSALGGTQLPGAAGALMSGDPNQMAAALMSAPPPEGGEAPPAMTPMPAAAAASLEQASATASGAAGGIASGALAAAGGGGGGGGAGDGTWAVTVNDAVTEQIGGLAAISSLQPISLNVGGALKEVVGAARIEVIRGSKTEMSNTSKLEGVVGLYLVDTKKDFSIDAKGAVGHTLAAGRRAKIGKSHTATADGALMLTTTKLKVTAQESITLKCGQAEVVIKDSGVEIKGNDVTIKGSSSLRLDPAAIGPG